MARAAAVIIIQSEELNVALSTAALDLGSFQVNVRQTSQCKPAAANTIIIRSQMEAVCTFMLGITTNIFTEGYDNDIHGLSLAQKTGLTYSDTNQMFLYKSASGLFIYV